MAAILFGSYSTLADTSEIQREAFNAAFAESGLDWSWTREQYRAMLVESGGADRIARFAAEAATQVDAAAVHAAKSRILQHLLRSRDLPTRDGVADTITAARAHGHRVGLVTTTSQDNVSALVAAISATIPADAFDVVVDASHVARSKPAPDAYLYALDQLSMNSADAVAIEDNPSGVAAAVAANIRCVAFPNANTAHATFTGATATVDALDPDMLLTLAVHP